MGVFGSPAREAVAGQWLKHHNWEIQVEVGDETVSIWGHSVTVIPCPLDGPEVVLLSDRSTPQKWDVGEGVEEAFFKAVQHLVGEGVQFYTFLRPGWNWPAFLWTREAC